MAVHRTSIHLIALMLGLAVSPVAAQPLSHLGTPIGNTPPVANIRSPVDASLYIPGETVTLSGSGTDREDGTAGLHYAWNVHLIREGASLQGAFRFVGASATFDVDETVVGRDGLLEVELIVTDSGGLRDTTRVTLYPSPGNRMSRPNGPGDLLHVAIYAGGDRQEDFTAKISPEGTITVPLIGTIGVSGLTTSEMSSKVERILRRDFFVDPQVLVSVKEQIEPERVYIAGEVKRPGAYAVGEGLTVLNACVLAGGFTDFAAPNKVTVTRQERGQTRIIAMDLSRVQRGKSQDIVLQSGDRIVVPHRLF